MRSKWWLVPMAVLLLMPLASAKPKDKTRVPEGGSTLVYVLGAGMTCLSAMAVRARSARQK
ncbi:MAG TPA: hypothetical protein VGV15_21270 [Terriglobales bacterium]|nr:hypothetical protein [Terriglobales bacterium]